MRTPGESAKPPDTGPEHSWKNISSDRSKTAWGKGLPNKAAANWADREQSSWARHVSRFRWQRHSVPHPDRDGRFRLPASSLSLVRLRRAVHESQSRAELRWPAILLFARADCRWAVRRWWPSAKD